MTRVTESPCYQCKKRHPGCHATCPDYEIVHEFYKKINLARRKASIEESYSHEKATRLGRKSKK